ncbi:MAG: amino acid permease [Gammaproteobacteria bacterium]|nr:amino acid permease [Gammaproteobacteria bacterium]
MVSAGETRDPRRDIPFAIGLSLLVVLALYAGVQIVCIAATPALAQSTTPLADAAVVLWGPVGQWVIATGAVVIMLGTLSISFLATSRLAFAFAEQGDVPPVLARVHSRFRTPHVAILVTALLVWLATLANSFLSAIVLASIMALALLASVSSREMVQLLPAMTSGAVVFALVRITKPR